MTLPAEMVELVDALGARFEGAIKHGLSMWVDPALLRGEAAESSTSPASRHVELQIALGTVFEWRLLGSGGKTLWVVENGSSSLEVAFDRQPSGAERGQPMPTGTRIRGRWDRVYVRMRTAGTGTARIILYNDDIDVSIANPVTGGTPISVTEAIPVYTARPGTTTEEAEPVYLAVSGGVSPFYGPSTGVHTPVSGTNSALLHMVGRPIALQIARTTTALAANAVFTGGFVPTGVNTGGVGAASNAVGVVFPVWPEIALAIESNAVGTMAVAIRDHAGTAVYQHGENVQNAYAADTWETLHFACSAFERVAAQIVNGGGGQAEMHFNARFISSGGINGSATT